jgi:nitrogen regulatory protein PII
MSIPLVEVHPIILEVSPLHRADLPSLQPIKKRRVSPAAAQACPETAHRRALKFPDWCKRGWRAGADPLRGGALKMARILHFRDQRHVGPAPPRLEVSESRPMQIMKMITAVVRPFKLGELRPAIAQLGVQGVTVTEVHETAHGPRSKLEIAVDDSIVEPVIEAIGNIARTGRAGDGWIIVTDLEQAIRIRTGETGTAAT